MITKALNICTISKDVLMPFFPENIPEKEIIFFDIETTGLNRKSCSLYLIGIVLYEKNEWKLLQFLAESESEELTVLMEFSRYCQDRTCCLHFNGSSFDIPFLNEKFKKYKQKNPLDSMLSIDLYRKLSPFKSALQLTDGKQKSFEAAAGFPREDLLTGKDLINVYHSYEKIPDIEKENLLFLHNRDDMLGMLFLLSYAPLLYLLQDNFTIYSVELIPDPDTPKELLLILKLPCSFPIPLSVHNEQFYLTLKDNRCAIKITMYEGSLHYFYPNYKDYYFLPLEEIAVHKSVGAFVDADHRRPAKACECFASSTGAFLPLPRNKKSCFKKLFRKEFDSKEFFLVPDAAFLDDLSAICSYASLVIKHLL